MHGSVSLDSWARFLAALGLATAVSLGLLVIDAIGNSSFVGSFLFVNLVLAWVPLGLVICLQQSLSRKRWSSWEAMGFSILWLIFLPNTFYMISDFIHLADVNSQQLLYTAVMFSSFIYTGVLLGFSSLYIVHQELAKRFSIRTTITAVALTLLACSFAIYIGRDLRWNTWDIVTDPAGVLFEVSTRLLHPSQYPQVLAVVTPFFALLGSMYIVARQTVGLLKPHRG
jgi:uncharacterized membrane protein